MVNLKKWEEIRFEDIRMNDTLKRITVNSDGTTATVVGVAIYKSDYLGTWTTQGSFRLVDKNSHPNSTKIYRRKAPLFEFPKAHGSVIHAKWTYGRAVQFILDIDGNWISLNTGMSYTVQELREKAGDFTVARTGVKL
jgi:hypothetical protein